MLTNYMKNCFHGRVDINVKWKLLFQLSMFGLAMGIATVFFIPPRIEPVFWLVLFLLSGYLIAKQCASRRFLHGVLLGLINSVWITGEHILFFDRYLSGHPREAAMSAGMASPRLMMAGVGPVVGLLSGVVIGLLALAAGRLIKQTA